MFRHPIPSLDHPNVLYYVDVLIRDSNVGDRVVIIESGGIGFDAKMWMEHWGVDSTNKARAGASASVPYQRRRGRRKKQQRGEK